MAPVMALVPPGKGGGEGAVLVGQGKGLLRLGDGTHEPADGRLEVRAVRLTGLSHEQRSQRGL